MIERQARAIKEDECMPGTHEFVIQFLYHLDFIGVDFWFEFNKDLFCFSIADLIITGVRFIEVQSYPAKTLAQESL